MTALYPGQAISIQAIAGYLYPVTTPPVPPVSESFWGPVLGSPTPEHHLADDHEVLVIGAGIVGLTTALLLARRGVDVAVVDARRPGSGTTGKSSAKATLLHGTRSGTIRSQHGADAVRQYVAANRSGQDLIREICSAGVDTQVRDCWTYATTNPKPVTQEYDALREAGLPARLAEPTELPFETEAAVCLPDQLQINPVQYLAALEAELVGLGVPVVWPHRVASVDSHGGRLRATTTQGLSTTAKWVIIATLMPFPLRTLMFATASPQRSYVMAARIDSPMPQGMYLSAESPSHSLRTATSASGEELLLVGGHGHPVGKKLPAMKHLEGLAAWTHEQFGVTQFTHRWSAQDFSSSDSLPQVGASPLGPPRVLFATGFGKWGITNGSAAAQILAGHVTDELPAWGRLFRPRISSGMTGWRKFATMNADVAAHLAKGWLLEPRLSPGRNGVRRDLPVPEAESTVDGVRRSCSAVCTHLGGIVRWNDVEQTWDCPLHGSRFAPDGTVLEGPAVDALHTSENGVSSRSRKS